MIKLDRLPNENEEQFIWRLGQAKEAGTLDIDWQEIAQIINEQFRSDESEYRTEAAYRKPYQMARRFFESGVFGGMTDEDSYIKQLSDAKKELAIERLKLSDERTEFNKKLRTQARNEADLAHLEKLIKEKCALAMPSQPIDISSQSNKDMIICISDFHLGENVTSEFGSYNSEIAADRLQRYFEEIQRIQELHEVENAYVILLGDLISGKIKTTIALENRENIVEQIQIAAELLSGFLYQLSGKFKKVYVNGVAGNHSRVGFKDEVLRDERLDNLIPWYMKAALNHIWNIKFLDSDNIDPTIAKVDIRGNRYIAVHGCMDRFDEKGISKLVLMLGYKPEAIFYGHKHHNSFDSIADVKIIRSGSFSGTGNDFCVSKRISGQPSQMVCIADDSGIIALYPISLIEREKI